MHVIKQMYFSFTLFLFNTETQQQEIKLLPGKIKKGERISSVCLKKISKLLIIPHEIRHNDSFLLILARVGVAVGRH